MSCTGIVEASEVSGGADGGKGWFKLGRAVVTLDSSSHTESPYALSIDFLNESREDGARTAVELTPDSAKRLVDSVLATLSRGVEEGLLLDGWQEGRGQRKAAHPRL